jgi:signal transduction histidine kinase
MTPNQTGGGGRKLTVNDVRHHAEEVRDLAKAEVRRVTQTDPARVVAYAVVGVLVVASVAYNLGSRRRPPCDAGS